MAAKDLSRTGGIRPPSQLSSVDSYTSGDVLSELNGGSSIRRVVQRKEDTETSWKPNALPLASAPPPPPPPSSFSLNKSQSLYQSQSTPTAPTSGLRAPTSSSKLKPLTLQPNRSQLAPPSTPSSSSLPPSDESPSTASTTGGFFPKFKAKLTDSTRPKKKTFLGGTSQAHIVTPARSFISQPPTTRTVVSSEDEGGREEWDLVEQEEEDEFWEERSGVEKENVKVSIR